jgi:SAM-dependent methyltransferase
MHPVSNCFVPDVKPVWREAFRVLRPGGTLIAGFNNPDGYVFDQFKADDGELLPRHRIPYSDLTHLTPEELDRLRENEQAYEWSHTLNDQIGGQIAAGFHIIGFYEDAWVPFEKQHEAENPIDRLIRMFMATRALKPKA